MADVRTQQARERAERWVASNQFSIGPGPAWAHEVLYLADRVAALETALRDLRDAALPVVISYENCKAWAKAVGDEWVGVPDVENLAAALAGVDHTLETPTTEENS